MSRKIKKWLIPILAVVILLLGGAGVVTLTKNEDGSVTMTASIEYSNEELPAVIETEDGEMELIEAPTVESVDQANEIKECGEGEECGRGWYVDTSSPQAFKDATYGLCVDTDGHFGSQCWDEANLFWQNYAGRPLSTCGTGAAKGTLKCYEHNAGSEFTMVWNSNDIQAGDFVVFNNGVYGHIGMALGGVHNGYVALLGANQGGASCPGGGSTVNIINISVNHFGGAFRPNIYIKPEPKPTPETKDVTYEYVKGDYFSKVLVNLGLDEGNLWGADGSVRYYTQQLIEQDVLDSRGNVKIGVPFTLIKR